MSGSIGAICDVLAAYSDPVAGLANVSYQQNNGRCVDIGAVAIPDDDGSDLLSWPWQTCSEFAFYQTCELGSQCPFARGYVNVSDEISICQRAFGLSPDVVASNVQFSNLMYQDRVELMSAVHQTTEELWKP